MAEVAVVIPTYRRETRLRFALEALAEQTLDRGRFEVVVARAAGEPGPYATAPDGLAVRFVTAPSAGPGVQRNAGWRATEAPLIAFTDDDCRPDPGWLAALLGAAASGAVSQGRTEPDPDELHLLAGLARTQRIEGPSLWHETCNIAYPRELLERLGGFDEAFGPWGEDTDLGLRATEAGATHTYEPRALAHHAVLPRTLPRALAEARRRQWLALLIARHPALREALYCRLFANRAHAAIAAGALAGIAIGGRRGAVAATLPFLAHNLAFNRGRGLRTPRGLARFAVAMPSRLAIDVTDVAFTVRGAIRHRAPVI